MNKLNCPTWADFWTVTEAAECLEFYDYFRTQGDNVEAQRRGDALYIKLWDFMGEVDDPTPLGGDGSEGTTEEPIVDKAGDALAKFWERLEGDEQAALIQAWHKINGPGD